MRVQLEFMEVVILQNINRKPVPINEKDGWKRIYERLEDSGLIIRAIKYFNLKEVSIISTLDRRYSGAIGGNVTAMAWQITERGKQVLKACLPVNSLGNIQGTNSMS